MSPETKPKPQPRRRKLINKRNRSAWILSFILIILMVVRLAAGFRRPATNSQVTNHPAAIVLPITN